MTPEQIRQALAKKRGEAAAGPEQAVVEHWRNCTLSVLEKGAWLTRYLQVRHGDKITLEKVCTTIGPGWYTGDAWVEKTYGEFRIKDVSVSGSYPGPYWPRRPNKVVVPDEAVPQHVQERERQNCAYGRPNAPLPADGTYSPCTILDRAGCCVAEIETLAKDHAGHGWVVAIGHRSLLAALESSLEFQKRVGSRRGHLPRAAVKVVSGEIVELTSLDCDGAIFPVKIA